MDLCQHLTDAWMAGPFGSVESIKDFPNQRVGDDCLKDIGVNGLRIRSSIEDVVPQDEPFIVAFEPCAREVAREAFSSLDERLDLGDDGVGILLIP